MNDVDFDFQRESRQGFPEIVFGEGKSVDQLLRIAEELLEKQQNVFVTRLDPDKAAKIVSTYPDGDYDEVSRSWIYGDLSKRKREGRVALVSAGSSDRFVIDEAARTLKFLGIDSHSVQDCGVAGIHRLMNRLPELDSSDVLIVAAGFEGALPSVVGGLARQPIIAVPVSVGYGVAAGGETALRAMLTSCAAGLTVVNIDNGFGAALGAFRILNLKYGYPKS